VATAQGVLEALTGVYHADGSLVGELRYLAGKLLGTTHCGLCDITHGTVRLKDDFRDCRSQWSVPFGLVHLDERSGAIAQFTEERTPCVVGHTSAGLVMLLDPVALDGCAGDVEAFRTLLDRALAERALSAAPD
jgi:hypothetical protein